TEGTNTRAQGQAPSSRTTSKTGRPLVSPGRLLPSPLRERRTRQTRTRPPHTLISGRRVTGRRRPWKMRRAPPANAGRAPSKKVRRRPTLPHSHPCSTIGAERLNFRVRNGTGCFPLAITTERPTHTHPTRQAANLTIFTYQTHGPRLHPE